jgi:hypothetical protein
MSSDIAKKLADWRHHFEEGCDGECVRPFEMLDAIENLLNENAQLLRTRHIFHSAFTDCPECRAVAAKLRRIDRLEAFVQVANDPWLRRSSEDLNQAFILLEEGDDNPDAVEETET